jgi:DNA-binding MarR family transcriptional regulator
MVQRGLLMRESDRHDGRRVFITLAPHASAALRCDFAYVVEGSVK